MTGEQRLPATEPRVLVLLATYNGADHIDEQLRSLARQASVSVTVLMSDDGSSDDTIGVALRTAAACGLELSVLPSISPSGSAARNFFRLFRDADLGACDFIALCDQDDIWLDTKLSRACSELARSASDAYSCNSVAFWPDGRRRDIRKDFPQRRLDHLFESASQGCTYVLTRSFALGFKSLLSERATETQFIEFHDWLIYAWARTQGLRWHMDSAQCILYRQSGRNVIGANAGMAAIRERVRRLRGGWLSTQAIRTAECVGLGDHPVVHRLRRLDWRDRMALAFCAPQYRRRPREQLVFVLACLTIGV